MPIAADIDGASHLTLRDLATGALRRNIELPPNAWVESYPPAEPVWSPGSRYVAVSFSSPTAPGDILLVDAETGEDRLLTDSPSQLGDRRLAEPVAHRLPTRDGEHVPCLLYPPTCATALNGSAVLMLHGAPRTRRYASSPLVQSLAAAGHTVLVPNVRGSTGYGKRWYSLDDGPRRLGVLADLAAIHDHLPALGVDPNRAALWGASYGGYLTLAGCAFQPDRWAAGVDIAGISDLTSYLQNTAPQRRALREREYGSLEHDADFLHAASPITRAQDIRAPLLVVHGQRRPRPRLRSPPHRRRWYWLWYRHQHARGPVDPRRRGPHPHPPRVLPRALTFLATHLARH